MEMYHDYRRLRNKSETKRPDTENTIIRYKFPYWTLELDTENSSTERYVQPIDALNAPTLSA